LGSAFSPISLASEDQVTDDDVMKCLLTNENATVACWSKYSEIATKNVKEMNEHKSDPWNMPEKIRKEICCGLFTKIDCDVDAVKGTVGCPDKLKKFYEGMMARPDLVKTCGKFTRSTCKN